eukprot:10934034-Alexandrium_andersonii.AAC.1
MRSTPEALFARWGARNPAGDRPRRLRAMADGKKRAPRLTIAQRMALDRRGPRPDWSRAEGVDV